MLGCLERDADPGELAELAGPHSRAVHDELGLDIALAGRYPGNHAVLGQEASDRHSLDDPGALLTGALGERHGDIDRIHPAVRRNVEPRQDIVGPGQRPQVGDLPGGDLVHVNAAVPVEGRDPAVLLQPARLDGKLDEAYLPHPGREAGLGLEAKVEVPGVLAELGGRLGGRAKGGHQAGRVPGRPRGEPVAFEQDDVPHAQVRQVVGNRRSDNAAAYDHDPRPVRQATACSARAVGTSAAVRSVLARRSRLTDGHACSDPGSGAGCARPALGGLLVSIRAEIRRAVAISQLGRGRANCQPLVSFR